MSLNQQGFNIFELSPLPEEASNSFADLSLDIYVPVKNRYRRFTQYRMRHENNDWQFESLPHRAYVTYSKFNSVAGGVEREYEPIITDFTGHIRLAANSIPLDTADEWQINVHQYRIFVKERELEGVIVPEGLHKDGHDYVFIGVYDRHNITGAELSLRPDNDKETPFFITTLPAGKGVVFEDKIMWHYVTQIEPIDGQKTAYRDTVVVAFSRWSERWYGENFDQQAISEGTEAKL